MESLNQYLSRHILKRYAPENEFYRDAIKFAKYQPLTYTLDNAIAFGRSQEYYDKQSSNYWS